MARRRMKKRTHAGAQNGSSNSVKPVTSASRNPKSMVIRIGAGEVGPSVSQLVKDVRAMMEPETASRLKVCLQRSPFKGIPKPMRVGTQIEQTARLHNHGRSSRCISSPPLLPIEHRQHKSALSSHSSRSYSTLPCGQILTGQGRAKSPKVPQKQSPGISHPASPCHEQLHFATSTEWLRSRSPKTPRGTYNHHLSISFPSHISSVHTTLQHSPSPTP